jgi:hypothetical protein
MRRCRRIYLHARENAQAPPPRMTPTKPLSLPRSRPCPSPGQSPNALKAGLENKPDPDWTAMYKTTTLHRPQRTAVDMYTPATRCCQVPCESEIRSWPARGRTDMTFGGVPAGHAAYLAPAKLMRGSVIARAIRRFAAAGDGARCGHSLSCWGTCAVGDRVARVGWRAL